MTTVLCTNLFEAARKVKRTLPKNLKSLPVLSCIHLYHHDGNLGLTTTDLEKPLTEYVPARIDGDEWETCVGMKPFLDWLRVTVVSSKEIRQGVSDQINLTLDASTQILKIKAGNTRAEFKCIDALEFPPHPY